ncbi:hypothetical protein PMAYCL1PPCAC_30096, partial [Pristionchus mayeri]
LIRSLEVDRNEMLRATATTSPPPVPVISVTRATTRQLEDDAITGQIFTIQIVDGIVSIPRGVKLLKYAVCHTDGNGTEMRCRIGTPAT